MKGPETQRGTWETDRERAAWVAGCHAADKILRDTIRQAMDELDDNAFLLWLSGFLGDGDGKNA